MLGSSLKRSVLRGNGSLAKADPKSWKKPWSLLMSNCYKLPIPPVEEHAPGQLETAHIRTHCCFPSPIPAIKQIAPSSPGPASRRAQSSSSHPVQSFRCAAISPPLQAVLRTRLPELVKEPPADPEPVASSSSG